MQQITREFNYSESTFVFPAEDGHTRKVRIFTPTTEVPFAGHPNIGTAFTLASIGELGEFEECNISFEERAGVVPISIRKTENGIWSELRAPEALNLGQQIPIELTTSALSLTAQDIVTTTHQPQLASVGLPFVMVELKDRGALERARLNMSAFDEIHASGVMPDIHMYVRSNDEFDVRTRMFAPLDGVPEDPATGSANCALAAMLTHYEDAQDGEFSYRIAQGVEMKRPSILDARAAKESGKVTGVWIAGHCVMVSEGHIHLD